MNHPQLIILGGGIIGLSIAWEASRRGLSVQLVDRGSIGRGTSWTAAGILPPANEEGTLDPIERMRGRSHRLHIEWAEMLRSLTGIDNGLRRCGGLYLATSPGEAAALVGLESYWRESGISARRLNEQELVEFEPELDSLVAGGQLRIAIRLEDEYQIRCPDHLNALHAACVTAGVQMRAGVEAQRFFESNGSVTVETNSGNLQADALVLAGGSWSAAAASASQVPLQIIPVRGQIMMYHLDAPPFRHVINEGNRYFVPREDGHLLVGSCEEEVGFDDRTTTSALESFRRWAERFLPTLAGQQPVKSWAGLRPNTIDGFPYIGRIPQSKHLFVATGHYRSGIHLSCATAVAIVDLLTETTPTISLEPFRVGRG